MNYKHSCIIDAEGNYKTLVLVILEEGEEGETKEAIQYYTLQEGESLVDTAPPVMRPYAGAAGFISPKWDTDTSAWVEAASAEEIAVWEAEHPAPEVPEPSEPSEPSGDGDLGQRVAALEASSATKSDVQAVWDQMAAAYNEGVQGA